MWSLFRKKESGGIFDYSGEKLEPIKFSSGKTQADIVKEVLEEISRGCKVIFIKGVCGTGKSAIALNLARNFKKTSIVVPIKSLQEQYENDYTQNKFILKKDSKKMKISVIKGRNNFRCPFTGENSDDSFLPCTIEIKEKNMDKLMDYIGLNKHVSKSDFSSVEDVKRMAVAPACPYWSPVFPSRLSNPILEKSKKKKYTSVSGAEYTLFQREKGCGYYNQYESYVDSDVLIFNSHKYLIESAIGRKPKTELDVIDECDEFLDSFSKEQTINLNRLLFALSSIPALSDEKQTIREMINSINSIILESIPKDIEKLEHSKLLNLIKKILDNPFLADVEESSYYNRVFEIAKDYEHFIKETYVSFESEKTERGFNIHASLVTTNLAKRFKELLDNTDALVLMSGTLHSEQIIRDVFDIKDFKIIEAETIFPGTIIKKRTNLEKNCKYENFKNGSITREDYLKALSACVEAAAPPVLVHVNSFEDLPSELEKAEYNLNKLITKEKLISLQNKASEHIEKFKSGEIDILFTTKCSRGIDFPGQQCNSIILTRYPYPNIQSLFWKILRKENPSKYMEFYLDKARRELLQKIYRGLRFKDDKILLLSPDVRVLNTQLNFL